MTALTRTQRAIIIVLVVMVIFSFVAVLNLTYKYEEMRQAQDKIIEYIGGGR